MAVNIGEGYISLVGSRGWGNLRGLLFIKMPLAQTQRLNNSKPRSPKNEADIFFEQKLNVNRIIINSYIYLTNISRIPTLSSKPWDSLAGHSML